MLELALHILDLIENCINAGATVVEACVATDPSRDTLSIAVDDNGPGFSVPTDAAMNPFYTTKRGKRVGLGLSLFRAACEQAGGTLVIERSPLGGARVVAQLQLTHVDRQPLGDLAGTLATVAWANPEIAFRFKVQRGAEECRVDVREVARELRTKGAGEAAIARAVEKQLIAACGFLEAPGTQFVWRNDARGGTS